MRFTMMIASVALVSALMVSAGCEDSSKAGPPSPAASGPQTTARLASPATKSAVRPAPPTAALAKLIRINCGAAAAMVDRGGNAWLADVGFADGDVVDRGDITIADTATPEIYRTEHFGMTAFSRAIPNGKYTVKLHFCETYDGVVASGERVFSVDVEGAVIRQIDPFKDGGGLYKPSVRSVDVEVRDGKLDITFTPEVQNPEINAIEIIPK